MNDQPNTETVATGHVPSIALLGSDSYRLDLFAAHALQGLLASGQFTETDECGVEWGKLEHYEVTDENGAETGQKAARFMAVELAARLAECMVRALPNAEIRDAG